VEEKKEVLVVASKLKAYIKNKAQMNTSGAVMEVLTERVRRLCDEAIGKAQAEGRKTVMDRDFS
jgi:histone H3/H4